MRYLLIACILFAGCSGSTPTAPTMTPTITVVTPPPVVTPPVTPPVAVVPVTPPVVTVDPILSDPRYSASFYRMFALGVGSGGPYGLRRLTQAPRIYLRTVDDAGKAIDAYTLNETAASLINTAGKLTGVFGVAGLEQGPGTREGQPGWITVRWSDDAGARVCGLGYFGGGLIILYPKTAGCRCAGGPQVRPVTVKHELGHALGFYHVDDVNDLMHHGGTSHCDKEPSPREIFHAALAYSRPVGSLEPR